MLINLQIEEPLSDVFYFEETQCFCVKGVPTHPDNTVIRGLGYIEIPSYIFNDSSYTEVRPINEPSLVIASICFGLFLLGMIKL